jgi:hypothetical protein
MLVSLVDPFFTMRTVSIPQLACRSKWRCINQTPEKHHHHVRERERERFVPGLSATNLITAHPFLGTPMVLTSGGSFKLKVFGEVTLSKLP